MNSWFSNSWLLRGLRKSSNKPINTDDEEEYSYPREKQATTVVKKETPFSGAMTSAAESWVLCQDRAGQQYWWNEVTGQWTYQLYNTQQSYLPQMMPNNNLMYAQQQQQYGGMASSPQYLAQQPWLGSPSRESQAMHAGGAAGAWGWQQGGVYSDDEEEEEEEEEEEVVKGVWDKYYTYRNGGRQPLWIHSATGIRTTVDPTA